MEQYTGGSRIAAVFPALVRLGILRVVGYPAIDPALPEHERAELETQLWTTQLADTFHDEYPVTPTTDAQVRATGDLGALPLVVLTATEHGYPPSYPRPASLARMIACARSTTCSLLKMFET